MGFPKNQRPVALVVFCAINNVKIPIIGVAFGVCRVKIACAVIF
jgi:hypothetical protein